MAGASPIPAPAGTGSGSTCTQQPPACAGVNPGGTDQPAGQVSLAVTIYPADNAVPTHVTLRCDPAGGTVPDPASACAQLLADPGLLEPSLSPQVMMCPMILAGSARAVVDGTYLGRQVNEVIYDGGCDMQRWTELMQIFG